MRLIKNNNISLSLNIGKTELMFTSTDEVLKYFKPCEPMVKALRDAEENACIGFIKAHSFTDDDHDFIQIYKKNSDLDDFEVIFEDVRLYRGFIICYSSEMDFRNKMVKIDRGDTRGFYELKNMI